eukprot:8538371-Alexandrium_andersonii.AAC.1
MAAHGGTRLELGRATVHGQHSVKYDGEAVGIPEHPLVRLEVLLVVPVDGIRAHAERGLRCQGTRERAA